MMENVPPELALVIMAICSLIVLVLLLVDRVEQRMKQLEQLNLMLASRIESMEGELGEWLGQPRKLLESDLRETEVITNGR